MDMISRNKLLPAPLQTGPADGGTVAADDELLRLRARAVAEIGALRAEIDRLAEMKEQTRADLRHLLQDCLARLDTFEEDSGSLAVVPGAAAAAGRPVSPVSRLLHLCHPVRRRLAMAGWDQAPMLLVTALIILQQLAPAIQRMALHG